MIQDPLADLWKTSFRQWSLYFRDKTLHFYQDKRHYLSVDYKGIPEVYIFFVAALLKYKQVTKNLMYFHLCIELYKQQRAHMFVETLQKHKVGLNPIPAPKHSPSIRASSALNSESASVRAHWNMAAGGTSEGGNAFIEI